MNQVAPKRLAGAPKRPIAAPKGLELVPRSRARTSDHRTCCQNLSRRRFWKAETALEKQSFTCFLILPDEFIDNQIDNLAITKNCQKGSRAARDQIHPLEWRWNMYLGRPSLALKPKIEYSFDLKIQRDEQNLQKQKARKKTRSKLFWPWSRQYLPHFEDEQLTADCWPWSAHIADSVEMRPPNQQPLFDMLQKHANRYSERSKSITLSNDRLRDP